MDPDRYRRIKDVLLQVLECPRAGRASLLDRLCQDDAALRREVEELLAGEAQQTFMEHSPLALGAALIEDADASGSRLGRILLQKRLASGGMGEVYAGVDELLQRPVAVKLMKAGLRMSAARRSGFLAEARVLSSLQHPNICEVHDFFEDQDQDVLVLELIEGQTLRSLLQGDVPIDRIGVALQIIDALVAAHERGIAHRDLKPENVMVTSSGRVKVLDFGLARISASPSTGETRGADAAPQQTQVAGTPGYLSPEQARGEPSTVAADLWSFGVLLVELLTGRPPWPTGLDSQALLQRARRGEADVPRALPRLETQLIRRLLDPAAERRPSARETRAALEQIAERPARRLRWGLAAAIAAIAAFSGWKYTVDLQQERSAALAAQARAEQARAEAEELAGFMLIDLYDGLRAVGRLSLLEPVALKAVDYYGELDAAQIGEGRGERAIALIRVAEVLDIQGHLAQSTDAYRRAMEALRPLAAQRPDDALVAYRLALATRNYGEVLRFGGDYTNGDVHAQEAIAMARALTDGFAPGTGPSEAPSAEERWSLLLRGLYLYADSLVRQGRAEESLVFLDEAEPLAVAAVAEHPPLRRDLADIRYKRCMAYFDSQGVDKVVPACRASFEMDEAMLRAQPEDVRLQTNLASAWWMLGRAQELAGELDTALESTEAGLRLARDIFEREPGDAAARNLVALMWVAKGRILHRMQRAAESADSFRRVLAITEPLVATDRDHATVHNHLIALTYLGRIEEARPFAKEVYDSGWRRPEFLQLIAEFNLLPDLSP